jgi:hypothetical protein
LRRLRARVLTSSPARQFRAFMSAPLSPRVPARMQSSLWLVNFLD